MKALAILFLLCTSLYGADMATTNVVGDITTVVFERTAKDGKPEMRAETVYRGKERILETLSLPRKQGKLVLDSRAYRVDGELVMVEDDNDGDGIFESIALFHPGTGGLEVFTRQPDGSMKPASTQIVEARKEHLAELRELLKEEKASDEKKKGSLQQTPQKAQDVEKEKDNKN